ncbi:cysteine proteinase [Trypanosoma conorhini]|uniref:Cysteine proteinase n=1 Tax=Trypanosoma conorhini TaxID=83891 RepID=A0A3R7LF11_9TRYP|nr:cysteine proteinase [Trypanosoma conorhini]RNF22358.1 cysteine proteinase [Trypanosoma conorhini]
MSQYCMARGVVLFILVALAALTASAALVVPTGGPMPKNLDGYNFDRFLREFGKVYDANEYVRRRTVFERTLAKVRAHNAAGGHLYVMGINHMSDWTPEEFASLNGAKPRMMRHLANKSFQRSYEATAGPLPTAVDYRNSVPAVLTAVKDQGLCGSCWAHAAVEEMETHYAMSTGRLHVMSQQLLTSCAPNPDECGGTGGCQGSTADLAYEYARTGITSEWERPYTSYRGETAQCGNVSGARIASVKYYVKVPSNAQDAVMRHLVTYGPLSVNVDATDWSSYAWGIFHGCDYGSGITINHVVQLVGYGHDNVLNASYWILRNSWSPGWGENGYIRLLRTNTPECGWDVNMQDGTACKGDPSVAWACGECGVLFDASFPAMV